MIFVPMAVLFNFVAILSICHADSAVFGLQSEQAEEFQRTVDLGNDPETAASASAVPASAVQAPAVQASTSNSGSDKCASVFSGSSFDYNRSNLSASDTHFMNNFQLQAVLKNESRSCREDRRKMIGCYYSVQECMLRAWSMGRRVFMYGSGQQTGGECWIPSWPGAVMDKIGGDFCIGGLVENTGFNLFGMVNRTVDQPIKVQMALLAAGVRPFALPATEQSNAWITEAVMGFTSWESASAIYRKKDTADCVLAFGGVESEKYLEYAATKLQAGRNGVARCGFTINEYVVNSTEKRLNADVFRRIFEPVLKDKCTMITVVGIGIGGAVAETVAACMNNGYRWSPEQGFVQGDAPFMVSAVYTVGAPPISNVPLINNNTFGERNGNCFDGKRIFIEGDPLVTLTDSGTSHPRMDWIVISERGEGYGRAYSFEEKNCSIDQQWPTPVGLPEASMFKLLSLPDVAMFRLVGSLR